MGYPPPQLGFNDNVRYRGHSLHIQTEDSGLKLARVTTQLFADGGRVIHSSRTDYSAHVGHENLVEVLRKLMRTQHKAMYVALRRGEFDGRLEHALGPLAPAPIPQASVPPSFSELGIPASVPPAVPIRSEVPLPALAVSKLDSTLAALAPDQDLPRPLADLSIPAPLSLAGSVGGDVPAELRCAATLPAAEAPILAERFADLASAAWAAANHARAEPLAAPAWAAADHAATESLSSLASAAWAAANQAANQAGAEPLSELAVVALSAANQAGAEPLSELAVVALSAANQAGAEPLSELAVVALSAVNQGTDPLSELVEAVRNSPSTAPLPLVTRRTSRPPNKPARTTPLPSRPSDPDLSAELRPAATSATFRAAPGAGLFGEVVSDEKTLEIVILDYIDETRGS